jgi:hypothetical protein
MRAGLTVLCALLAALAAAPAEAAKKKRKALPKTRRRAPRG